MSRKQQSSSASNVFYMLKILIHGSKGYVIYTFVKELVENVFWTVFSVYLTEWIYKAIENEKPFAKLVSCVGAMCVGHICIHISAALHQLCEKQFLPKMYQDFYKRVIRKSISMEYVRFEQPDFYDKYTRVLNECQQRGSTILYNSAYLVAGIASVIAATVIVAEVDPMLLLFIVPMVAVSMYFGKKEGELYYALDFSNTRDGRIGSYTKRVFYEKKYAGELRLFGIGKLLLARHEKAYDEMQKRSRKMRAKLSVIEPAKWVLYKILSAILPYLYITFVLNTGEALKLIMRLYDVTEGSITFGGTDIRKLNIREYREKIGVVFQDFQIYGATLAENVKTDHVNKDDTDGREKITAALKRADFGNKLANLPDGLDTELTKEFSDNGTVLSGGEAQKAAIARMFTRDIPIAILDEPSSALDPIAEYRLNTNMLENAANQAVILISHRLSTTKDADRIVLLENGCIAESGTHEELLAHGGTYAKMWNIQAEKYCAGIYS